MSTDTPRTTERLYLLENEHDDVAFESLADFAKKLEREATEAHRHEEALRARVAEQDERIDWLTGQREIENRRADQAEKVQKELEKSLEAARQISIARAERIQNLAESNDSIRSAIAQAEGLLRDWIAGGECFCCAEGVAARGPCEYCKTNEYFAAQKGEAQ